MSQAEKVRANYQHVKQTIEKAATKAQRRLSSVELIAIGKTFGADRVEPLLHAGHRCFGENRVQEAESKWPAIRKSFRGVELHLIGGLQTNKVKAAVQVFDVIETLDRPRLARALAKEIALSGKKLTFFIQVNTGNEPQKSGISPNEADAFIYFCRDELKLSVSGLMCIPPTNEEPSLHFALLQKIAKRNALENLSMGMSSDYEIAIQFGATHVRVGSAIFGERG